MEDSDQFSGAGLYGSWSGCLADDLDDDDVGPSLCDATKVKERGVFRAIRLVFSSFYNESATLERMRHGVDEHDVGMAVLVHHSFPDEIERANGVATLTQTGGVRRMLLVTQLGAVSQRPVVDSHTSPASQPVTVQSAPPSSDADSTQAGNRNTMVNRARSFILFTSSGATTGGAGHR